MLCTIVTARRASTRRRGYDFFFFFAVVLYSRKAANFGSGEQNCRINWMARAGVEELSSIFVLQKKGKAVRVGQSSLLYSTIVNESPSSYNAYCRNKKRTRLYKGKRLVPAAASQRQFWEKRLDRNLLHHRKEIEKSSSDTTSTCTVGGVWRKRERAKRDGDMRESVHQPWQTTACPRTRMSSYAHFYFSSLVPSVEFQFARIPSCPQSHPERLLLWFAGTRVIPRLSAGQVAIVTPSPHDPDSVKGAPSFICSS